jgi:hypothetical protein
VSKGKTRHRHRHGTGAGTGTGTGTVLEEVVAGLRGRIARRQVEAERRVGGPAWAANLSGAMAQSVRPISSSSSRPLSVVGLSSQKAKSPTG